MTGKKIREGIFKWCVKQGVPYFNTVTPADRGEPDTKFLFSNNGRAFWVYIEIKGTGDKLSFSQIHRIGLYRAFNQATFVVKTVKEGTDILQWYQIHPNEEPYPHYSRDNEK